jgi:hypothetical protein
MEVGDQRHAQVAIHQEMTPHPLYRTLGGLQGRSGPVCSPPPRFDPRTVHPVASRYIDYVIPAHK